MYFIFCLELTVAIPDAQALTEHVKSLIDYISIHVHESCSLEYISEINTQNKSDVAYIS